MSEKKNVTHIDSLKIRNLETKSTYNKLLEEFDLLRSKVIYNKDLDKREAIRFVTLIKYFIKNAHSEAFKIQVEYFHDKFIKDFDL